MFGYPTETITSTATGDNNIDGLLMPTALSAESIVYSQQTGNLFYNQNGADAGYGNGGNFAMVTGVHPVGVASVLTETHS